MALKDWKRAKSGESNNFPRVWRNKKDGDDVVYVKRGRSVYLIERDDNYKVVHIAFAHTLKQAEVHAKNYMKRTH